MNVSNNKRKPKTLKPAWACLITSIIGWFFVILGYCGVFFVTAALGSVDYPWSIAPLSIFMVLIASLINILVILLFFKLLIFKIRQKSRTISDLYISSIGLVSSVYNLIVWREFYLEYWKIWEYI